MKHLKLPLYALCAFLVTLTFTQCGEGVGTCDTTTCSGCCDASGFCQPGPCQPGTVQTPDASTLTTDTDAGTTQTCSSPLKACGNSCVDTQTDGSHCGACGKTCAQGAACKAGQCETLPSDCTVTPCPSTGFYCDLNSKQCKAGCVSDSQCAGQNVTCDTSTRTCVCIPETDAAFCARLAVTCGPTTGTDNCGAPRNATCGAPCAGCAAVTPLDAQGGIVSGAIGGASTLTLSCGGSKSLGAEKVYSWTPTVSGNATVSTCISDFDTVLEVRSGACGTGTVIGCNDDSSSWCEKAKPSLVNFSAVAGTTYYFTVDGANGAPGHFNLKVASPAGRCTAPFEVLADNTARLFTLNGPNLNSGSCGGNGAMRVHHFKATKSGPTTVKMETEYWPSVLYVRSGTCGTGAELACDYQTGEWPTNQLTFNAVAGTDYYIWGGHEVFTGDTVMYHTLTVIPPP